LSGKNPNKKPAKFNSNVKVAKKTLENLDAQLTAAPEGINMESLARIIQDQVHKVFQEEITIESKNEKQLLHILNLRDDEVRRGQEESARVGALIIIK
jgi:hypothetical protein